MCEEPVNFWGWVILLKNSRLSTIFDFRYHMFMWTSIKTYKKKNRGLDGLMEVAIVVGLRM